MSEISDAIADAYPDLLDALGDSVSYQTPSGAAPFAVTVIWTEGRPARQRAESAAAIAWVRLSDFTTTPLKGDEITKGGKVYKVAENPLEGVDGMGGCDLILRFVRDVL